jgi:hypothetical protein
MAPDETLTKRLRDAAAFCRVCDLIACEPDFDSVETWCTTDGTRIACMRCCGNRATLRLVGGELPAGGVFAICVEAMGQCQARIYDGAGVGVTLLLKSQGDCMTIQKAEVVQIVRDARGALKCRPGCSEPEIMTWASDVMRCVGCECAVTPECECLSDDVLCSPCAASLGALAGLLCR